MKTGNLLKKELKELLTPQAIFSMLFTCLLLVLIGQVMGSTMDEAISSTDVTVIDRDGSDFTREMLAALPDSYGVEPRIIADGESLEEMGTESVVIIPAGFGDSVVNGDDAASLEVINLVNKAGLAAVISGTSASDMCSAVSDYVSEYTESVRLSLDQQQRQLISEPVVTVEYTQANGKTVNVPADSVISVLMSQFMIGPIAVFFVVMMASQLIMTAISTEKIDKTLETLLSAPVSRLSVLMAKMIAALIVALLNAGTMMVGFVFYIMGMTGGLTDAAVADAQQGAAVTDVSAAMRELGLSLSAGDMLLFGIQLFLTIAIGLAMSMILGAMATDAKSVQTLTLPVMIMTMLPFFASMFMDINSMSLPARIVMYIIPFTHAYTAMGNIMFGHMGLFWGGLVYQLVFFAVCMYLAVRVFTTDLLFTMSFGTGTKKRGLRKAAGKGEA